MPRHCPWPPRLLCDWQRARAPATSVLAIPAKLHAPVVVPHANPAHVAAAAGAAGQSALLLHVVPHAVLHLPPEAAYSMHVALLPHEFQQHVGTTTAASPPQWASLSHPHSGWVLHRPSPDPE